MHHLFKQPRNNDVLKTGIADTNGELVPVMGKKRKWGHFWRGGRDIEKKVTLMRRTPSKFPRILSMSNVTFSRDIFLLLFPVPQFFPPRIRSGRKGGLSSPTISKDSLERFFFPRVLFQGGTRRQISSAGNFRFRRVRDYLNLDKVSECGTDVSEMERSRLKTGRCVTHLLEWGAFDEIWLN